MSEYGNAIEVLPSRTSEKSRETKKTSSTTLRKSFNVIVVSFVTGPEGNFRSKC